MQLSTEEPQGGHMAQEQDLSWGPCVCAFQVQGHLGLLGLGTSSEPMPVTPPQRCEPGLCHGATGEWCMLFVEHIPH